MIHLLECAGVAKLQLNYILADLDKKVNPIRYSEQSNVVNIKQKPPFQAVCKRLSVMRATFFFWQKT